MSRDRYLVAIDLARSYPIGRRSLFRQQQRFFAVDGVSLSLDKGSTLGIVGESGCGKSTLARLLLGLIPADRGQVTLEGNETTDIKDAQWRELRRTMQLVYQDTSGSLDPRMTVRAQVEEPLRVHRLPLAGAEKALQSVGFSDSLAGRYPHELSGGQLQRVVIARALSLEPDILVLDEPVSALDVSIQAQIINLLKDLQQQRELTYLFVSHDLGVVRHISDRVAVMYLGQIVEEAPRDTLFSNPLHPYTRVLIDAVPQPDPTARRTSRLDIGDPPNPADPPAACRFHPRCPVAVERCAREKPLLRTSGPRQVACHLISEKF